MGGAEAFVEQVDAYCALVDRPKMRLVGVCVPVSFECPGYGKLPEREVDTLNDHAIACKYIADGSIAFLADTLDLSMEAGVFSARTELAFDGNYKTVVGIPMAMEAKLPQFLPENVASITLPARRYAKFAINEQRRPERVGFGERMHADEAFIGPFRKNTPYVYDRSGVPFYQYDQTGDLLYKYEPVKIPADERERFDSIQFRPVVLPRMMIACAVGQGDDVIMQYFAIHEQVCRTGLNQLYRPDFYGFPIPSDGEKGYASCFGSRVISFEGLPDCAQRITLPGGLYIHITQLEFNGDNPTIPYEVAFGHFEAICLADHPDYEFDKSRKVIARFRQANCASVFVPVRKK